MCDVMRCEVFPHSACRRVKDSSNWRGEREREGDVGPVFKMFSIINNSEQWAVIHRAHGDWIEGGQGKEDSKG